MQLLLQQPQTSCSACLHGLRQALHPCHTSSSKSIRCKRQRTYASADDNGSVVSDEGIKRPLPPKGTKLKRVESLGEESWAGVASVDRGEVSQFGRRALLLGGDTAVLFLFAAIGRKNHGEGLQLAQTFNTALPFLVGWAAAAAVTGAYSEANLKDRSLGRAASTAAKAWALAVPTALILRSVQRGYIPDKSFVIVSFLATGVLLIGWRSALAVATQKSGQQRGSQNKQGNPLEFLQLLASLTKRW